MALPLNYTLNSMQKYILEILYLKKNTKLIIIILNLPIRKVNIEKKLNIKTYAKKKLRFKL